MILHDEPRSVATQLPSNELAFIFICDTFKKFAKDMNYNAIQPILKMLSNEF